MLVIENHKNELQVLGQDLMNFGLNPKDWKVVREVSNTYRIQAVDDQNFIFKGLAERKGQKLEWQKLELTHI